MSGTMDIIEIRPWTGIDFLLMFLMWSVMMVGMMVPTAVPMTLIYAAVSRKAASQNTPIPAAGVFVTGYVVMWVLFSLGATAAQCLLDRAALLSPMMVTTSPALGAGLLIGGGVLPADTAQERLSRPLSCAGTFLRTALAGRRRRGIPHGTGTRCLLPGLLLGPDGASLSRRCDEHPVDRGNHPLCTARKGPAARTPGRTRRGDRDDPSRCRQPGEHAPFLRREPQRNLKSHSRFEIWRTDHPC